MRKETMEAYKMVIDKAGEIRNLNVSDWGIRCTADKAQLMKILTIRQIREKPNMSLDMRRFLRRKLTAAMIENNLLDSEYSVAFGLQRARRYQFNNGMCL